MTLVWMRKQGDPEALRHRGLSRTGLGEKMFTPGTDTGLVSVQACNVRQKRIQPQCMHLISTMHNCCSQVAGAAGRQADVAA